MSALGAVYQLSQAVELAPSPGGAVKVPLTVGLRGEFRCDRCSDAMKEARGFCPFVENPQKGTEPTFLGDQEADTIWACPQGIALRNPGLAPTLRHYFEIQSQTPFGHYGEGLICFAPRVSAVWSELHAQEQRFLGQIRRTRSQMDARANA
jgi:hypothetical protein